MPTFQTDFLTRFTLSPLSWIFGSILLYIIGTHLAWLLKKISPTSTWLVVHLQRSLGGVTGSMLLRLVYFAGLPYLALILGVVAPRFLGVSVADWGPSLLSGLKLGLMAFVAIAGCLSYYAVTPLKLARLEPQGLSAEMASLRVPLGWSLLLVEVVSREAHWAFYRAGIAQLLNDVYAGSFIGLSLVLLELYANPRYRHGLLQAGQAESILLGVTYAVLSTLIYLVTGNLWACIVVHLGITVGTAALLRRLYGEWGDGQLRGWRPWRFTARAAADTRRRG